MNIEKTVLPLKDAYVFGTAHGLESELLSIKEMEVEWDHSYTSSVRRGFVIDLFVKHQLFEVFKQQYWPAGNTEWGKQKCEFWLQLKYRFQDFVDGRSSESELDEESDEDRESFVLETHLRDYLAKNLGCIEPGLRLYQVEEQTGVEFPLEGGRIDILAVNKADQFVVFELKVGRGRNKVIGQLLYYMGWIDKHLGKQPCRGIIVAKDITEDLVLAVKRVQGVSLFRYKLNVSVEKVT